MKQFRVEAHDGVPMPSRRALLPALAALLALALGAGRATADIEGGGVPAVVVVGGDRDYPPYEFLDRDGQPAGYNVDLTRAIAETMGMKVEFRFGSWPETRAAFEAGDVDVLEGISWSRARLGQMDFTPPHTVVNHVVFGRRGARSVSSLADLKGRKVTVHGRGIMDETLTALGYGPDIERTETPADAMRLLASGKNDYAVVAVVPGTYLVRELQLSNLVPVSRAVFSVRYCYAVRRGRPALLARFTEGLAILKSTGRYDDIHQRWLGVLEPPGFPLRTVTRYAAAVVLPLLFGLGVTVLWSRSLKVQVGHRTAELAREVAERERAVEELRINQQQLVQADKMAALGILVSGVAHEINNPNGFILLNMPALKESFLDALEVLDERFRKEGDFLLGGLPYSRMRTEIPGMLDEMAEGSRRIKRIVEDLKDFARSENAPRLEPIDLNAVVGAAVRLVDAPIRKATARFETSYGEVPRVLGRAQRIEQVVVNLVLNACQALPDSARAIRVATRHDAAKGVVVLEVTDEGVGIPPEHLSRLTDPFFTTKRETGGTGLGLSVSDGIAKEHGGTLDFSSVPGEGTTARLTLPVAPGGSGP